MGAVGGEGGGLTAEFALFGFFFVDAFGEDGGVFVLFGERWGWRLVGFFIVRVCL